MGGKVVGYFPASFSLTLFWNLGSIIGIILMAQIFRGLLLTLYYSPSDPYRVFKIVIYDSKFGWLVRIMHANMVSVFFLFCYIHIFKGLLYGGYRLRVVWLTGVTIYFFLIIIASTGYSLVWREISYWATVVITSLITAIPYLGEDLVMWLWGGYSVGFNTLKFFYTIHFLLPWSLLILLFVHLVYLHKTGSSSKLYCHGDYDKITFYPLFVVTDYFSIFICFVGVVVSVYGFFNWHDIMMFIENDVNARPTHVVPEWYFLFAFSILRSVSNKILGVTLLLGSVFVLLILCVYETFNSLLDNFLFICICIFSISFLWLTWAGWYAVEFPFDYFNFFMTLVYFFSIRFMVVLNFLVDKIFRCICIIISISILEIEGLEI